MKSRRLSLRAEFAQRVIDDVNYRHWVLRELYKRQEPDEKAEERTKYLNEVGFNSIDDQVLSRLAEKYNAGKPLTATDEDELCNRLPKYWQQFLVIALATPPSAEVPKKPKKKIGMTAVTATREAA